MLHSLWSLMMISLSFTVTVSQGDISVCETERRITIQTEQKCRLLQCTHTPLQDNVIHRQSSQKKYQCPGDNSVFLTRPSQTKVQAGQQDNETRLLTDWK